MHQRTCAQCGEEYTRPFNRSHAQWAKMRYCSARCANTWRAQQQTKKPSTTRREGERWARWWEHQRYQQDKAQLERDDRRRQRVERATRPLARPRQFVAGTCPDCGDAVVVIRGWWHDSIRCPSCTKRRWQGNHKQRAMMRGVDYEDIDPAVVFARDKRICQICGKKTRGKYPAPTSASIDHITPLSKNGPHLMHNVQTACLHCNVKKHNGAANDQLRLALVA